MPAKVYQVLFLTERSPRHQQAALDAAPPELAVTMLRTPDRATLLARLPEFDFLITERTGVIDAELIAASPKLKMIQRLGSLVFDIDVAAAQSRGIPVCSWPIEGCILVAEHMMMQLLALAKRLPEVQAIAEAAGEWSRPSRRTDENTFAYNWSGRTDIGGLYQKRIGILGFGEIGAELARRLRGFAPAQILYYKRNRLPGAVEAELGITYATQDEIIAQSDFLCSLLPFYPATELSLNHAVFARMQPGAKLVSCGSGSVIQENELAAALQSGQVGGVALDTFEWEPLQPDNPLLQLLHDQQNDQRMNILLTPHTAAGALPKGQSGSRIEDYANIIHFLNGQKPLYQVEA